MQLPAMLQPLRPAAVTALCCVPWLLPAPAAAWLSIPSRPAGPSVPAFSGSAADPVPLAAPPSPQHPHLAHGPFSNIHNDAWMSDAYPGGGPLGRAPRVRSGLYAGECATHAFDRRGRLVTVCVRLDRPSVTVMHPVTLAPLATHDLPPKPRMGLASLTDVTGGGYFYLDDRDRVVTPTADGRLRIVRIEDGAGGRPRLRIDADIRLGLARKDQVVSVAPDWDGLIWFVTSAGVVGTVDDTRGTVRTIELGEGIDNSVAADVDGSIYVVSDRAMYRMRAGADGTPGTVWREAYVNSGVQKPGQFGAGSGTTPTVLPGGLVTITDNADPMNVVVYRTAADPGGPREVCRVPVFARGASATENSLIGAGRTIVVANNYGFAGPLGGALTLRPTAPGLARIDVADDLGSCRLIWSVPVSFPSSVNKLSLSKGLVYGVTRDIVRRRKTEVFSLQAVDVHTGAVVWSRVLGGGPLFNNNYAAVALGPDGSAYVGVLGGIARVSDGP
jgi:hypothetical protein